MRRSRWAWVAAVATGIALALFHPLRHANPTYEDFFYLALGPHLDNPLPLAIQDSTGSFFFRPVVMLFWWFTSAVTTAPAAHYAINIALHVTNGLLLIGLLRRMSVSFVPACVAGLVFVAHVTTFSAAIWLSDRFDLVTLALGLSTLIAVHAALERGVVAPRMALVAMLALACVFSKETGFAIVAVAALATLWAPPGSPASARSRLVLAGTIAACVVAALALRGIVIRAQAQELFLRQGLIETLWSGWLRWMAALPGFTVVHEGPRAARFLCVIAGAALIAAFAPRASEMFRDPGVVRTAVIGIALALVTGLAQAPVANETRLDPPGDAFDFGIIVASRLYYVAFAGLCITGGALGEAVARGTLATSWVKRSVAVAMLVACVAFVTQGRYVARSFAAWMATAGPPYIDPALTAVRARTDAASACKIYFLGLPEGGAEFRRYAHTAILAGLPRDHRATRCFFLSEHAPWYNVLQAEGLPANAQRPLATLQVGGRPFEPLRLGNLMIYFLRIPDEDAVRDDPAATFLAYENGRFVDVTQEIRSRRRAVRFFDNRPAS